VRLHRICSIKLELQCKTGFSAKFVVQVRLPHWGQNFILVSLIHIIHPLWNIFMDRFKNGLLELKIHICNYLCTLMHYASSLHKFLTSLWHNQYDLRTISIFSKLLFSWFKISVLPWETLHVKKLRSSQIMYDYSSGKVYTFGKTWTAVGPLS
jgi:hypothetical protein